MRPRHWSIAPVSTGGTTEEPVSVNEIVSALRLDPDHAEGDYLDGLIRAARRKLEDEYRQVFIHKQVDVFLDKQPCSYLTMPIGPLASVEAISGYDTQNVETSLSSSQWYADTASLPGRVLLNSGVSWPSGTREINGTRLRVTLGHSSAAQGVPDPIREAITQLVAFLYEHRGEGAGAFSMPPQVAELMAEYYIPEVA